jgi:uroporphyrinogen-III synthase
MGKPDVLILRPEPGAQRTAERARAMGLQAAIAPIFHIEPIVWDPPDPARFDAILLTSANAARHAGSGLSAFTDLPCFAVGEGTASAAVEAGFAHIRTGASDGAALVDRMAEDGVERAFHPCGRDHIALDHAGIAIDRRPVYVAEAEQALAPEGLKAIRRGALVLLHSPRAGAHFAALIDAAGVARAGIAIAALSEAAAAAAGSGWKSVAAAARPRDHALLELAVRLCKTSGERYGSDG